MFSACYCASALLSISGFSYVGGCAKASEYGRAGACIKARCVQDRILKLIGERNERWWC